MTPKQQNALDAIGDLCKEFSPQLDRFTFELNKRWHEIVGVDHIMATLVELDRFTFELNKRWHEIVGVDHIMAAETVKLRNFLNQVLKKQ